MPKNIEIDILMTIHNGDKYLIQTIDSLKSQKYKKWNLIKNQGSLTHPEC